MLQAFAIDLNTILTEKDAAQVHSTVHKGEYEVKVLKEGRTEQVGVEAGSRVRDGPKVFHELNYRLLS